ELTERHNVGKCRLVEPAAPLDKFGPEIPEMGDRAAERGQAQAEKDAQHLECRAGCPHPSLPRERGRAREGAGIRFHVRGATALRGLRLWMWPLSVPAVGSMTALISAGLPDASASLTALVRLGVSVTWYPTPPNASMIFS